MLLLAGGTPAGVAFLPALAPASLRLPAGKLRSPSSGSVQSARSPEDEPEGRGQPHLRIPLRNCEALCCERRRLQRTRAVALSRGDPRRRADSPAQTHLHPRAASPAVRPPPRLVLTAWLALAVVGGSGGAARGPPARPDLSTQSPSSTGEQRLIYSSTESTFFSKCHVRYGFISRSGGAGLGRVLTLRHPCW